MSDSYNGLLVILGEDIRDDDAQRIIDAIKMVKGVQDVVPNVAESDAEWLRQLIRGAKRETE